MPTQYDRAVLMPQILERIANGESLRQICLGGDMPTHWTVLGWVEQDEDLSHQYARAMQMRCEHMADEIQDIADDGQNDWMERLGSDGQPIGWQLNGEHVQRSKLRIDARKWLLAKMMPKKYGDRQEIEHSGGVDVNLGITEVAEEIRAKLRARDNG